MWYRQAIWIMGILAVLASLARAADVDVRKLGAVGDGVALDTAAIQSGIDRCNSQGGGIVRIPAGRYLCGTVQLKDNVTLRLEKDAILLGSTNPADYRNIDEFRDGTGQVRGHCLIGAVGARRVGIEGEGIIDGQGKQLVQGQNQSGKARIKPFLIRWVRCEDVTVHDVQLRSPGAWTMHFCQCKGVLAESVKIDAHGNGNNDGIDIDSCETVRIRNCDIDSGDDALCLKTTSPLPCRDIQASGCRLRSNCGTIKLGTESIGDFENIRVSDCRILEAGLGGIKLLSVDGARLQDVVLSDITMENANTPIFLRLGSRLKTFRAGDEKRQPGMIRNVVIRNVKAQGRGIGVLMSGIPGHNIEDVTLENVDIHLPGGGKKAHADVTLPENESAYPEIRMFGTKFPAFGLFARHMRGLKMQNVMFTPEAADERPAMVREDAADDAPAMAIKGKLLLEENFKLPAEYTKDYQPVREGWKVKVGHATWKRTGEGVASSWESGHMPVLTYAGSFGDAIIELEFRFHSEPGKWAACRISATNPELNPRAYAASVWANLDNKARPLGMVLEHDEWKPGVITPVANKPAEFQSDTWYTLRMELIGNDVLSTCNGVTVFGTHEKFGLPKTSISLGTGLCPHELRRLRVDEAKPNPQWKRPARSAPATMP